jgi:hypothetical protein
MPAYRGPEPLSASQKQSESPMEKIFEIYIRTTPERLWEGLHARLTLRDDP